MYQTHVINPVLDLAISYNMPTKIKAQALYTLADMIRGNTTNQDFFAKSTVSMTSLQIPPGSPAMLPNQNGVNGGKIAKIVQPTLVAIVLGALNNIKDEFSLRTASAYLFSSYLHNNYEGQLGVASTLTPPPPDNPNTQHSGTRLF